MLSKLELKEVLFKGTGHSPSPRPTPLKATVPFSPSPQPTTPQTDETSSSEKPQYSQVRQQCSNMQNIYLSIHSFIHSLVCLSIHSSICFFFSLSVCFLSGSLSVTLSLPTILYFFNINITSTAPTAIQMFDGMRET